MPDILYHIASWPCLGWLLLSLLPPHITSSGHRPAYSPVYHPISPNAIHTCAGLSKLPGRCLLPSLLPPLYPIPYTLYPIPYTLYPMPYALYPIPNTLYPIPYTLYPVPYTLYPIPQP